MSTRQQGLPKQVEWVWRARWTSYWFADKEIFDFTREDYDRKARQLKEAGVNAVITYGEFHFRWNFVDIWPQMLKMLSNICKSCHRYEIKVVEHHSANHNSHPVGKREWNALLSAADYGRCAGFLKMLNVGDKEYRGVRFSSMRQIDPCTGNFVHDCYYTKPFCHNNPDWQKLYFDHLKDIYSCGVDGIMTDDVGFYNNACGCIYCREKFKRDSGCEMPPSGIDDKNFYGNLDNPAYRAWVLWRIECHREHQQRVFDHFRGLGLELARPMYSSSNTNAYAPRGKGVALDNLDGLCSTVFTEVNTGEVPYCWLRTGAEQKQRNALAYRNDVPPMSLFYPRNRVEHLFCWALTKALGQCYWGTSWSYDVKKDARMLKQTFDFEDAHPQLYDRPEPISEVGVLFSARTVWLHTDNDKAPNYIRMSDPASTDCWAGWCEMLLLANIPFDVIGENDLEERRYFDRLRLIIVPNAVCLSDKQIKALKEFARKGGRIIITHQSGMKDESGAWRKNYPLSDLVGANYFETLNETSDWIIPEKGPFKTKPCHFAKSPLVRFKAENNTMILMELKNQHAPAVCFNQYGAGAVIAIAGKPGRMVCINRHKRFEKNGRTYANIDFKQNSRIIALMRESVRYLFQSGFQMQTDGVPCGFIIGMYGHGERTVLHVVNAAGTLLDCGKAVPIPSRSAVVVPSLTFPRADCLPGGGRTLIMKLKRKGQNAIFRSPEFSGEQKLVCENEGEYTVIKVPSRLIKCYGVIELK
ncbi:MAG: beta-galactosidase trimerization domain-containing protein [Kiritimatiellae bacterium]|nr:beta-galactosidase trimerization domain-containing protein [Kiritimatiellia bacterium]